MQLFAAILMLMLQGVRPNVACYALGVSRTSFYTWLAKAANRLPTYFNHPGEHIHKKETVAMTEPSQEEIIELVKKIKSIL